MMAEFRVNIWQPVYRVDNRSKWSLVGVSRCVRCKRLVKHDKSNLPPICCPECKMSHIDLEEAEIEETA